MNSRKGLTRLEAAVVKEELQCHRCRERGVLSDCANAEHRSNSDRRGEHEKSKQGGNRQHAPGRKDWCLRPSIDMAPPLASRQRAISGKCEDHTRGSDCAALPNKELCDDVEREHRETGVLAEDLEA